MIEGIEMVERLVLLEEVDEQNCLKLIIVGEVDGTMLEALEDYMRRQKKRLETVVSEQEPGEIVRQAITRQNYFT